MNNYLVGFFIKKFIFQKPGPSSFTLWLSFALFFTFCYSYKMFWMQMDNFWLHYWICHLFLGKFLSTLEHSHAKFSDSWAFRRSIVVCKMQLSYNRRQTVSKFWLTHTIFGCDYFYKNIIDELCLIKHGIQAAYDLLDLIISVIIYFQIKTNKFDPTFAFGTATHDTDFFLLST